MIEANGNASAKGARKSRVQGRFLAALEMTVWGMGLFHVAYNGYVWKAFPVSSSRAKLRDLSCILV